MSDAQTIMDYEALKRDADQAGFDIKPVWLGETYGIGLFGRKENDFTGMSSSAWFHTIKEASAWIMGYGFRPLVRQDFDHGVKK